MQAFFVGEPFGADGEAIKSGAGASIPLVWARVNSGVDVGRRIKFRDVGFSHACVNNQQSQLEQMDSWRLAVAECVLGRGAKHSAHFGCASLNGQPRRGGAQSGVAGHT